MAEQTVKLAAIGLSESAQALLDIAWETGLYTISAVGDERIEQAEMLGRKYECSHFTDYRQLIIQSDADFLLFGNPVSQCAEFIRLGLQEKYHILQICPPALNFEQLAEFYRIAHKEHQLFITLQNSRFRQSFEHIRNTIQKTPEHTTQHWHLISAVCHVPMGELLPQDRWIFDPNMAGGGVLLQQCYDLIDELILCFGMPQRVYGLTMSQAPDRQQRMSLTEDTAIVTMRFSDTLIAHIAASRTLGPARRHLRIHGKEQHLTTTKEEVVLYDNSGDLLDKKSYSQDEIPSQKRMFENIALSFLSPEQYHLYPDHGFDLNTFAVIEAAYLSGRTGMAEEPGKIFRLADIDPTGLL